MSQIYQALERACREKTSTGAAPLSLQTEVVRGSLNAWLHHQVVSLLSKSSHKLIQFDKRRYYIPEFLYNKL